MTITAHDLSDVHLRQSDLTGTLVVVDGSDGSGKTTLIDGLESRLTEGGHEVVRTRQPTTEARSLDAFVTYLFEPERRDEIDYRALLCMMIGDRLQHVHQVIRPALADGAVVLCDRYIYTQMVTTRTRGFVDEPWMFELYGHVPAPDVGIITDTDLGTAVARISARQDARESFYEAEHVDRNLAAYREMATIFGLRTIDTSAQAPEQCLDTAMQLISQRVAEKRRYLD